MPLAGLIVNRTHPNLTSISEATALTTVDKVDDELTKGVLEMHALRAGTARRELDLLGRFTTVHPNVPLVGVPALPFEVADAKALRVVAEQIVVRG